VHFSSSLAETLAGWPIGELNNALPYRSSVLGVMQVCGHDGHITAVLGAAALLLSDPDRKGTVRLIFQPAEEGLVVLKQ
jgi:hippurate hydrolase